MAILPHEAQGVVPDLLNVLEHEAAARVKAYWPLMPLADRARAKSAQHFVRVDAAVPILPINLKRVATTRRADLDRRRAWT